MKKQRLSERLMIEKVGIALAICLVFLLNVQFLNAQNSTINVRGVVTDGSGEPIIGASVVQKGNTSRGTITDLDGAFTLQGVPATGTLVITYIGYKTVELPLRGKTQVSVKLEEDTKTLEEVVVVGYGSMRKKDLTGSVVQINPTKIADQNPGTVQDLLRGTPGLQICYSSSAKSEPSIQLRGQNSLYTEGSHNAPLIILDGMAFGGELSEINPDDIAQIGLGQLHGREPEVGDVVGAPEGIGHLEVDDRIHGHHRVVLRDDLLGRNVQHRLPHVHASEGLDEGQDDA